MAHQNSLASIVILCYNPIYLHKALKSVCKHRGIEVNHFYIHRLQRSNQNQEYTARPIAPQMKRSLQN